MEARASLMDTLDETPPSVRTAQMIDKRLGSNRAGRSACMAIATGDRLTQSQKRAMFRLGRREGVPDKAVVSILKQTDGVGLTPMELGGLEDAATAAGVSPSLVRTSSRAVPCRAALATSLALAVERFRLDGR